MKTSFFTLGHRDLIISTPAIKLPKTIHSPLAEGQRPLGVIVNGLVDTVGEEEGGMN